MDLARLMPTFADSPELQTLQIRSRSALVDAWGLTTGQRVLELGCGQGDMTVVLADRVGPTGRVVGCDPAPPSYGAPVSIGASTAGLAAGPLGGRLRFHLQHDVVVDGVPTIEGGYDVVVIAHAAWYVASTEELVRLLAVARAAAPVLCLSEWDPRPRAADQWPHLLAVAAHGLLPLDVRAEANVRNPLTRDEMLAAVTAAGWTPQRTVDVDTTFLPDGRWEVELALAGLAGVPAALITGALQAALASPVSSLTSYAVTATG